MVSGLTVEARGVAPCSLGLSATSQQYFSLRTNPPPPTNQQYFSLRTNQHQPPAKRTGCKPGRAEIVFYKYIALLQQTKEEEKSRFLEFF
jgi:hypothetical protein